MALENIYSDTLRFLKYSLGNKKEVLNIVKYSEINEEDYWKKLYDLCEIHKIVPMVYEAAYKLDEFKNISNELQMKWRKRSIATTINQMVKSDAFLKLYKELLEANIDALVVKGIICRSIYPNPDQRISSDEDILIKEEDFKRCEDIFFKFGLIKTTENEDDMVQVYICKKTGLHIELHRQLFSENSYKYNYLEKIFKNVFKNSISVEINGVKVKTFSYDEHLLYLICHSTKHFLASGFGIRQLCDLVMFVNCYGKEINWEYIWINLKRLNLMTFVLNLMDIGVKYLGLNNRNIEYPNNVNEYYVKSDELLSDIMYAGIYGTSTSERQHSALMTLGAMENTSKLSKFSSLKAVFPSVDRINNKYVYLRKYPILLPIAWIQRIFEYIKNNHRLKDSVNSTIIIGNKRIELLKEYKLIS